MNSVIFDPLAEFLEKYRELHFENTKNFFDNLVKKSQVNIEENRKTVAEYNTYKENLKKLKKTLNWWRFLRVVMCITILLIPLVIMKITPKIRGLRNDIEQADKRASELLELAYSQMQPLNSLFTDRDSLNLIHETIPLISFDECFTAEKEEDMKINYDFSLGINYEESTLDVLSGEYNENPFVFENTFKHTMGTETYHGYKTIYWTETYRDSNGKLQQRTKSETLHASVTKPKPFYNTQVVLNYGSQGAPELSFTRDATHLEQKGERAIERYVKKGEKKLKKLNEKALNNNKEFVSMSNTEFEVLFDALDRDNEVQFRTLFTPLAQTNMVKLLLSRDGFGDDFNFIKSKRMNKIVSSHSQGREMTVPASSYTSYFFDTIQEAFINKNISFFKALYFDFAPLLSIPAYQERPVHSLKPVPDYSQIYSLKECEALANIVDKTYVVHPETKTPAIIKSEFINSNGCSDETLIKSYSYDIIERVDIVPVYGGDGRYHNVEVFWDDYIPLEMESRFFVSKVSDATGTDIMATRNEICMYKI